LIDSFDRRIIFHKKECVYTDDYEAGKKLNKWYNVTHRHQHPDQMETDTFSPGATAIDRPIIGFKLLIDLKTDEYLYAHVLLPMDAIVICPNNREKSGIYDLRTDEYKILKIMRYNGDMVTEGISPFRHTKYTVGVHYFDPELDTGSPDPCEAGMHFWIDECEIAPLMVEKAYSMRDIQTMRHWIKLSRNCKLKYLCFSGDIALINHSTPYTMSELNDGLISACNAGHRDIAELMISRGANLLDDELYHACKANRTDIVVSLIAHGAKNFDWGLYGACVGGHMLIADFLINIGEKNLQCAAIWCDSKVHQNHIESRINKNSASAKRAIRQ
jgi:hypothetical protein